MKRCKQDVTQKYLGEMFHRGLLKDYIHADEERNLHYCQSSDIPSLVQLNAFSSHCRRFLKDTIRTELEEVVNFFKDFRDHIDTMRGREQDPSNIFHRINILFNDVTKLLEIADNLKKKISSETDKSTNTEIVKRILDIEQDCVLLFKIRRTFSLHMKPVAFAGQNSNVEGSIYRQISDCDLQTKSGMFGCIVLTRDGTDNLDAFYAKPQFGNFQDRTHNMEVLNNYKQSTSKWLSALFYGEIILECQQQSRFRDRDRYSLSTRRKRCLIDVCEASLYSNILLEKNKLRRFPFCSDYSSRACHHDDKYKPEASIFETEQCFTTTFPKTSCSGATDFIPYPFLSDLSLIRVHFGEPFPSGFHSLILETPFVNAFVLPIYHNHKSELESCDRFHFDKTKMGCLACVIGNRSSTCGLETLLIRLDESSNTINGICIAAARMNCKIGCYDGNMKYLQLYKNSRNIFSLNTSNLFEISYRSIALYNAGLETALQGHRWMSDSDKLTPFSFSVRNVEADLVCFLKKGIFIVNHGSEELQIRKLKLPNCTIDITYSITEQTVSVPVEKLIPHTAVEVQNNEVLVVCGIQGDNSKFVMIFPEKKGGEAVEMLEVRYPNCDFSDASVIDLEIAPDGTVMFVLENKEGKYVCVSTKYFMP